MKIKSKIVSGALLCTMCAYTLPVFAYTKDETVYTKIDRNGKNYQTIVSTHIENNEELDLIQDMSDLLNIENTKGEEEFKQDGNSLVWKADKKDIYYQGESQKNLPIECQVKYELDQKEVKAEEILGKTGKVKIVLHYINKEEHIVNINGKEQKMYTPFVVVAGTVIPNDTNKNIKISNGKIVNDGSKAIVMGIAMPGLQESLGVKTEDVEIPNDIEIEMDATDFELGNIITFVTPKVLEDDDLKIFDKLDELYSKANTMQTAGKELQEGGITLANGSKELADGTKQLKDGTNTAFEGSKQIKTEVAKATKQLGNSKGEVLDKNTLETIENQAGQSANLSQAQKEQIGNTAQLKAEQSIQSQKSQIGSSAEAVAKQNIEAQKAQIGSLAASKVSGLSLTEAQKQQIRASVKAGLEANATYASMPEEQKAIILQFSQNSSIEAAKQTAGETAKQVANQTAQETASKIAGQVANSTAQSVAEQVAGQVANQTAVSVAQETAIQTAKTASTATAKQVSNQVKEVATKQVASQMSTLNKGLEQLTTGLENLNEGAQNLENGANKLSEGADTLANGIKTFNEEAIQKICNYINSDVKDMAEKVEQLTQLSKQYQNFTMLNEGNNGNVKFIMIIDSIKKQEEQENGKEQAILETPKSEKDNNSK